MEPMKLTIDTGVLTIALEDTSGESLGEFKFNPSDTDILKRYKKVTEWFENVDFSDAGTDDEKIDAVIELSEGIKKQFDYLLGYNASETVFARCGALTLVGDGDMYFEKVLEGIAGVVEKTMKQRVAKKKAKIRKYTGKYGR